MKSATKKFAVLNVDRGSKVVLPMNISALEYIIKKHNKSFNDDTILCHTYVDNNEWSSFRRMSRATYYSNIYTVITDTYQHLSYSYMRLIDKDVKISRSFFNFLIDNTGLKYTEDETGVRTVIVDETLIPENLTESFICKGKLVTKDNDVEIYGNGAIMNYHFSNYHPEIKKQFNRFMDTTDGAVNFGFEAEKVDEGLCDVGSAMKLSHTTGFKKEYDGSLGSNGFELISPILPLYNQEVINSAVKSVEEYMEADTNDSCGGHINLSKNGVSSREILKSIKGSIPVLYSIYQKRLDNRFCPAKSFSSYLRRPTKYSACYLKSTEILELRLFPAIKNTRVLNNRIELLRIMMGELYGKSALKVMIELATPTSNIHTFMLNKILDGNRDKLIEKIRTFARLSEKFGCGKISDNAKKKVNRLMQTDVFQIQEQTPTPQPVVTPVEDINYGICEVDEVNSDNTVDADTTGALSFRVEPTSIYGQPTELFTSREFVTRNAQQIMNEAMPRVGEEMGRNGFEIEEFSEVVSETLSMTRRIVPVLRGLYVRDNVYSNRTCAFLSILSGATVGYTDTYEPDNSGTDARHSDMESTLNMCSGSQRTYSNSIVAEFISIFMTAIVVNKAVGSAMPTNRMFSGWFAEAIWIRMYKFGGRYSAVISKRGEGITYGFSYNELNNTFRMYMPDIHNR